MVTDPRGAWRLGCVTRNFWGIRSERQLYGRVAKWLVEQMPNIARVFSSFGILDMDLVQKVMEGRSASAWKHHGPETIFLKADQFLIELHRRPRVGLDVLDREDLIPSATWRYHHSLLVYSQLGTDFLKQEQSILLERH